MGGMSPIVPGQHQRHATLKGVAGRGATRRTVRVEPPVWEAFGRFTAARNCDRAGLLRDFIRFCIDNPDEATHLIDQWRAPQPDAESGGTR